MSALVTDPLLAIRPMREEDLAQVFALEIEVYPFPWTEGIFHDCLRVGYSCWVLTMDDQVIGYGVMSVVIDEAHILNICISPEWQRRGLGEKLLRRLIKVAEQHGAETVFLEVRVSNQVALRLYEKTGFVEVGMRKAYYPNHNDDREDALLLSLERFSAK
ncbi:MAG: ribosomal protein S18-alanine N-acetyltransferase [Candidatus Thiodiazotropha lotti]|uniref:[Ribosomal protein bS18]-alanine N-acetyltransferase n=1 Tax=Candidatus Thiodiazotropha lotti TaxID=2792787 RepID=A0A9E4K5M2_9GAMM|nr:ribosomal protein S18-alanine N-acetyltransferase [Candidatus Thiodiazotropha lotti]ODC01557.1 ribosomal-protein-alanine N-acetyltransferase [Candidatus Thiodiazotropha endoloripes]MCG7932068.1 ribosomal protein S18-alanine N-acetyltransferase [Candidatus Thiodiazotropha lotti]MCG7939987.1 ribosomal protein S18-alanine N-acetyltransferase [Candidatus Thiodiazotropha lotti]MCG7988173.1 ribosomal protein S18-alanine N-acetyltransferase [Candidatus Thiodiazotropha lotti]